jgi:hypothetical protein
MQIAPPVSGSLFMVVAPSGAGKSTLVNALLAQDECIRLSVSFTTRPPRPGDVNGREYHFVTVEDFEARRDADEFLEWAEVHGNYYGTSRLLIEERMKSGTDVLLEIGVRICYYQSRVCERFVRADFHCQGNPLPLRATSGPQRSSLCATWHPRHHPITNSGNTPWPALPLKIVSTKSRTAFS